MAILTNYESRLQLLHACSGLDIKAQGKLGADELPQLHLAFKKRSTQWTTLQLVKYNQS